MFKGNIVLPHRVEHCGEQRLKPGVKKCKCHEGTYQTLVMWFYVVTDGIHRHTHGQA